jgi:acetyl esterase/lipase
VRDVLDAIAWLRAHAVGLGVDPHRIGLFGDSAGAHLAVLAAMSPDLVRPPERVAAVAGWSGPYDLATWRPDPTVLGGTGYRLLSDMRWFLGCTSLDDPACLTTEIAASPDRVVKAGDPPMLLATSDEYGPGCEIILPSQTTTMAEAARSVGVRVRTDVLHVCGHATGYAAEELGPTLEFFRSAFGAPAQS